MFEGFETRRIATTGCPEGIHLRIGREGGLPLLLLHGYPETGACWHLVAQLLAGRFRLVVPDLRGYGQSRARLLLWSGLCFIFLALNNLLIFIDEYVYEVHDLSLVRISTGVIGIALLLYGLIWEAE